MISTQTSTFKKSCGNRMPKPPSVICYICHREYGTASIGIHEKSCLKKWREQNDQLPPSERLPEPSKPQSFSPERSSPNELAGSLDKLEAYNTEALKSSTLPCSKCGRHFEASRLSKHETHCKPPPRHSIFHEYEARRPDVDEKILQTPLRKTKSSKYPSPERDKYNTDLTPCRTCGRKFSPDRIERHQQNCRATPLKSPSRANATSPQRSPSDSRSPQRNSSKPNCKNCGSVIPDSESKFCGNCGSELSASCKSCGKLLATEAKFCDQCGKPI